MSVQAWLDRLVRTNPKLLIEHRFQNDIVKRR